MTCFCGHCGLPVEAHELAPMAHSPGLEACRKCRAAVEVTGHHQAPIVKELGHHAAIQKRLEQLPLAAGADVAAVV